MLRLRARVDGFLVSTQRFLIAATLVAAVGGMAAAEAANESESEASLINVSTDEGTFLLRVNDPNVSVRIEGSELVVTGAGLKELRLQPGDLQAKPSNEGAQAGGTVVSITRGQKEILTIRRGSSNTPYPPARATPALAASAEAHPASRRLFNPATGHDYQRIDVPMTWQQAKEYCEQLGGHLATATTSEENEFIYQQFGQEHVCWLGATDEGQEGTWRWITGEPWDYENWHDGEPSNNDGEEHYLALGNSQGVEVDGVSYFYRFGAKWNDHSAHGKYLKTPIAHAVCEWDEHDPEKAESPKKVDEGTSLRNLQLAMRDGTPAEELINTVADHIKNFPDSPRNSAVAQMLMMSLTRGEDEAQSIEMLRKLVDSDVAPISAAAESRIDQLETLLKLKEEPLELKFTAVDGREFNLEDYRGKVVLIDFWATWCGPCVAGMPELIELYQKHHEDGFEIVGISFDRDKESLEKFVAEHDMPWVQYFDGKTWDNDYGRQYGIRAIPTMWLVGRDGKVIDFSARANLTEKVDELLAE